MRQHRNVSTTIPDVQVHITWTTHESRHKPITLRAYPINAETGVRLDGYAERRRKAKDERDIQSAQQYLVARVSSDVLRRTRAASSAKSNQTDDVTSPLWCAYNVLVEHDQVITSTWSASTQHMHMTYFKRKILPSLMQLADEWTDTHRDELRENLVDEILKTGRSIGVMDTARDTVDKHLTAAQTIYDRMCEVDSNLPVLSLRPPYAGRRKQLEQTKSLPPAVRHNLVMLLERLINEDPALAAAGIVMYDCGLRTAEAAAVQTIAVIQMGAGQSILVGWQVKDGHRVPTLKSDNAYRLAPMTQWGREMLGKCLAQIPTMTIDQPLCDPRKLSARLRTMLMEAGLDAEYLEAAERDALKESRSQDVSAYVIRRDWASRARNVCGLTSMEIDVLLGHDVSIPQKYRDDMAHHTKQAELARKLERHIHNAAYSAHPGIRPYQLVHGDNLDIIPWGAMRLANGSDATINVKVDLEAVLSTESITIIAPAESMVRTTRRTIPTHGVRLDLPVIGLEDIDNEQG